MPSFRSPLLLALAATALAVSFVVPSAVAAHVPPNRYVNGESVGSPGRAAVQVVIDQAATDLADAGVAWVDLPVVRVYVLPAVAMGGAVGQETENPDGSSAVTLASGAEAGALLHETGHVIDRRHLDFTHGGGVLQAAIAGTAEVAALTRDEATAPDPSWDRYALSGAELYARAFSQYVAERSRDSAALGELVNGGYGQWTAADFAPVFAAFAADPSAA